MNAIELIKELHLEATRRPIDMSIVGPDKVFTTVEAAAEYESMRVNYGHILEQFASDYNATIGLASELQVHESFLDDVNGELACGKPTVPVFLNGHDIIRDAEAMLYSASPVSHHVDSPWLAKIGQQGAHFHPAYLLSRVLPGYIVPSGDWRDTQFSESMSKPGYCRIVDEVAADFVTRVRNGAGTPTLVPLTPIEAYEEIAKDTSSFPNGGSKKSPESRQYCLVNWDSHLPMAYLGTRYQRNKHFPDGLPRPRCIFNADIVSVARCARWLKPIVLALQQDATATYDSPYCELAGPDCIGATLARHTRTLTGKPRGFRAISADARNEDMHLTRQKMTIFVQKCVLPLYPECDPDEILNDFTALFGATLVLPGGLAISGIEFALFSGIYPTHVPESFWTQVIQLTFAKTTLLHHPVSNNPITLFGKGRTDALIMSGGDDAGIVTLVPADWFSSVSSQLCPHTTIPEILAATYRKYGFDAASEKQDVTDNFITYMGMTYQVGCWETVLDDHGYIREILRYKPWYSPIAALNQICNPEEGLHSSSLIDEVTRVAMIVDSVLGSEHFTDLVNRLLFSLDKATRDQLAIAFEDGIDTFRIRHRLYSSYYQKSLDEWDPAASFFLAQMKACITGSASTLSESEKAVRRDIRIQRALWWRYRIDPTLVSQCLGDPEVLGDTFRRLQSFVTDSTYVSFALKHDIFGNPCPERDPMNYNHATGFAENFQIDDPMADKRKPGSKTQAASSSKQTTDYLMADASDFE